MGTKPFLAAAGLVVLALLWGYNWVVIKLALSDASPLDFAAMRSWLGALALFAYMFLAGKPWKPVAPAWVALLGLLQTTGFIGLTVLSLQNGAAGKSAVLAYTMPFWVLVIAWPALKEPIRGIQWLVIFLALMGLILVIQPWHLGGTVTANLLAVAAGFCWAISVVLTKILDRRVHLDLLSVTAWQMLFGSIPLIVLQWWLPSRAIYWSPYFVGTLVYNVIAASVIAWILWLYVLKNLKAGVASLGILAAPLVGVISAWIQLGERPDFLEGTGMMLIGVGLLLLSIHSILKGQRTKE